MRPDAHFCPSWDNQVASSAQATTAPSSGFGYTPGELEARKQIDWTKTGLLLLIIGIIIIVIPFIGIIGGILDLIGAILIILGRDAFGRKHSKYVVASVVIYILGTIASSAVIFSLIFSMLSNLSTVGPNNPIALSQIISTAINQYLPVILIVSATTSLALVLFTYAIQNTTGRILLWSAYGLTLIFGVIIFNSITQALPSLISQSSSRTFNPTQFIAMETRLYSLSVLEILPNSLYAIAYYLLRSRISRGEIPAHQTTTTPVPPPPS